MSVNSISVLGSTGSIGRQTLAAAEHVGIRVAALSANRKTDLLEEQTRKFRPEYVAVFDEEAARDFKVRVADLDVKVGAGLEGLTEAATYEKSDCIVTAVSGAGERFWNSNNRLLSARQWSGRDQCCLAC